ncbi:probable multidrug resistance-associated protein lethal(2)03659 isoform X2 [Pseudomyrmex gracilis]|uniref:probable multidrug resistance-associated protein lethal(2)03659 isoform X2 n=1 Tax=Pseudomyrmex gracilis TaxID=219809 RepID=UPI000994C0A3|nr:probable multidrug resistance-associated protein lethal(2)03659 isoform X2 [Pseudomyrmex gracilis]
MEATRKFDNPHPQTSANSINKLFFCWLVDIFWHKKDHDLELKDVYNILPDDGSEWLGNQLEQHWKNELHAAQKNGRQPKFVKALIKVFFWECLYYGGWIFFVTVILRVIQPYILRLLIWHFDPRATSTQIEAYLYATGVIIVGLLICFCYHHSNLALDEIGMRVKIAISSLIYRKILHLSKSSDTTPSKIITLLSKDLSQFDRLFEVVHYIWIMPIQVVVVAYLGWENIGYPVWIGIIFLLIQTIPINVYIMKWMKKMRLEISKRTEERVRLMSEIVSGIQVIKMYTWEKPFQELVDRARKYEIDILTLTSYKKGMTIATYIYTERTTLFLTVLTCVLNDYSISADNVFSMALYFNILQLVTAIYFPIALELISETKASIKRIEEVLLLDENVSSVQALLSTDNTSISMKNVNASWGTDVETVHALHNINFQQKTGQLYAIVGSVGAGKSSLIQAILGELKISSGQIFTNGKISYASQESWLFSGTVQNNILFDLPFNKTKYQTVIEVCALKKDFETLPQQDQTLVGDRGTALSGGQRARVNLARAVYRNADIYLLDDPLSAVDTHVAKHIFDNCISGYLKNKTRILVTHQLQYLKQCDYIILLNKGQIENHGTFKTLQEKQVNFLEILAKNEETKETNESPKRDTSPTNDTGFNLASDTANDSSDEEEVEPEETEEFLAKGSISKSLYWKYIRSGASIIMIVVLLLFLVLGQIGSSGCDYWISYWTRQKEMYIKDVCDRYNIFTLAANNFTTFSSTPISVGQINNTLKTNEELAEILENCQSNIFNYTALSHNFTSENVNKLIDKDLHYLDTNTMLWVYGAFISASIVFTTLRNLTFYKICMNASKNLHNFMFSSVLKVPMSFFNKNPSGRILNRFSKDIGTVDEYLPRCALEVIQIAVVMIGIMLQVLIINHWVIIPILIVSVLYNVIRTIYTPKAENLKRLEGNAKSPVFSHINSTWSGLATIRSADVQEIVRKQFDEHQDLHTRTCSLIISTKHAFGCALDIVTLIFVAFVTLSFVALDDGNTFAGNVGLAVSQILILCGMVQHGMIQMAEVMTQMTSVERIMQYTELEKEGPFESNSIDKPLSDWPSKGEIRFDQVSLRYSNSEPPVLKSLSFVIEPGMKIGIVGRTGAGKSSLISALFRMTHFDGTIYIDNLSTKKIGLHDLRKKISIIPQEPVLFSGTLRENLDPFSSDNDS